MKTLFKLLFRIIATFLFFIIIYSVIIGICFVGGNIANHFGIEPLLGAFVGMLLLVSIFIGTISL